MPGYQDIYVLLCGLVLLPRLKALSLYGVSAAWRQSSIATPAFS